MTIYVLADMEGISGITDPDQVFPESPYYNEGRRYMTYDINACVEGCLKGGAARVIVCDSHHKGNNVIWDELHPDAEYVIGDCGFPVIPFIEGCSGVILLGHHAMAGTAGAILEHTMSSRGWQNFWMNGALTGEIGIEAGVAGDYDIPVIMVSGDDKACIEAEALIPGVVTACVKSGSSVKGGKLLSKAASQKLIIEKTAEAVGNCGRIKPFKVERPVTMRLELIERGTIPNAAAMPYMTIIDGRTYEVCGGSVTEALRRL